MYIDPSESGGFYKVHLYTIAILSTYIHVVYDPHVKAHASLLSRYAISRSIRVAGERSGERISGALGYIFGIIHMYTSIYSVHVLSMNA